MTIQDTATVDAMGFRNDDGQFELIIYDHLDWSEDLDHLNLLQEKVNNYVSFLGTGQIAAQYPDQSPEVFQQPWIRITFANAPPAVALEVLGRFAGQLNAATVTLAYLVSTDPDRTLYVFE